jgi:radical SAM superfamily enzyme YgiQ (UPF0313 family)
MKIALVYPRGNLLPREFDGVVETRPKKSLLPLGMLSIVANSPADIDFIDNRVNNMTDVELYFRLKNYDVVGFGGTIFESEQAVSLSWTLMQNGVFTIYGGANATVNYDMYDTKFSQIVIGEADDYDFKSRDKIVNLSRKKNLDDLLYPYRGGVVLKDYNRHEKWLDFPTDTVISSRGCPYDCSFCSSRIIWDKKYTMRSAENVVDEVKYLVRTIGTKSIYFREDNFTISKKRLTAICNDMPVMWKCESRVDAINDETARIMSDGGCSVIWFGIEHTSDKILRTVSKGTDYRKTMTALEACYKYGIKTVGSFIVGLPEESIYDMILNVVNIRKLGLDHVSLNRAYAFPVSDMYHEILRHGLDVYSHNGIILPKTKRASKEIVDTIHYLAGKYFAVTEKYFKQ